MHRQWNRIAAFLSFVLLINVFLNIGLEERQYMGQSVTAFAASLSAEASGGEAEPADKTESRATLTSLLTPSNMTALLTQRQQNVKEDGSQNNLMIRGKAGSSSKWKLAFFLIILIYILLLFATGTRAVTRHRCPSYFWRQIIHYIHAKDGQKSNIAYRSRFITN